MGVKDGEELRGAVEDVGMEVENAGREAENVGMVDGTVAFLVEYFRYFYVSIDLFL